MPMELLVLSFFFLRTIEKNERHGPCKMTKQPVFGSNHFKDLTTEEFQNQYLTGYKGPRTDQLPKRHRKTMQQAQNGMNGMVFDASRRKGPLNAVERHPVVQERYEKHWKKNVSPSTKRSTGSSRGGPNNRRLRQQVGYGGSSSGSCDWYDISCWLRWIVNTYAYNIGGTMEPEYDSDSYPSGTFQLCHATAGTMAQNLYSCSLSSSQ